MSERLYTNVKIIGTEKNIVNFVKLCKTMQQFGAVGHSDTINVWVDGDGASRMKFEFENKGLDNITVQSYDEHSGEYRIDFE